MKRIFIHFGLHKTGTTSIQNWLRDCSDDLLSKGYLFYKGFLQENNHIEFGLSVIREDLDVPLRRRNTQPQASYFEQTQVSVKAACDTAGVHTLLISCEMLSYCRSHTELQRLKSLFPDDVEITPVLFVRDKAAWLESFKGQLASSRVPESQDPSSCAYVADDSWLLDHEKLIDLLRDTFGDVIVGTYDGSSVGLFRDLLDLPVLGVERRDNVTSARS